MSGRQAPGAAGLERELAWLSVLIETAIHLHLGNECPYRDVREVTPPELVEDDEPYVRQVREAALSFDQRAILALALAPHLRPHLLDPLLIKNPNLDRGFTEFGGVVGAQGGFVPTLETAVFLLCGEELVRRFAVLALFDPDGTLRERNLLRMEEDPANRCATPLVPSRECLAQITTGAAFHPAYTASFPAKRLTTPQGWRDLVLADQTMEEILEIRAWIEHRETLLEGWQLARKIKPGFRSLFYGPPGTGKTFTAALLGKATGLDVYRVDLSQVVSKWIGETEKNLASIFDLAERNDWILFFDEADALFGKRTQTSSSHDRYANQEVAYLLQRIEDFPGTVILATNLKSNMDEAFARRFQSMIFFPMPGPGERLRLWRNAFAPPVKPEEEIDFERLAAEFELSGGAIINVLRYAALTALRRGEEQIRLHDIRNGIRREFRKSGKTV